VVNCISAKVLPSTGFLLIIAYCAVERQHARYYREGTCSFPQIALRGEILLLCRQDSI
jgi:hypothetical protein